MHYVRFLKGANPGLFLFIFKHKFYIKTVGVSAIQTRIVGLEGEQVYDLITTTAKIFWFFPDCFN